MRGYQSAIAALAAVTWCTSVNAAVSPLPVDAYGAPEQIAGLRLSQDGKRIAYVRPIGDDFEYVVQEVGGPVLTTVKADHKRLGGIGFADPDHVLMAITGTQRFGGETATYELTAVIIYNLKSKTGKQIFPSDTVEARGLPLAVVHKDGHVYGYFEGTMRQDNNRLALYRTDLDTFQSVLVTRGSGHTNAFAVGPDGEVVARTEEFDHGQSWKVMQGSDGEHVYAAGRSVWGFPDLYPRGRTADTFILSKPEDGEFNPPREVKIATGEISGPLADGVESSPIVNRTTRLAIGLRLDGFVRQTVFFDEGVNASWQAVTAAFKDEHVEFEDYSSDLKKWLIHVDGPHDSGRYFLVDVEAGKAVLLGADFPNITPEHVGSFDWFDYTAQDGTKLRAVVTLPPGRDPKNLPFIMLPHGGPGNGSHDEPRFDWWAQALANRGYVVIQPDFRGSGGLGHSFEVAGWGKWGREMETDVSDAIPALAAKGIIDPKRGCIVGWSYGGYATLAGVTVQNGIYRCAVAGGAVADMGAMLQWEIDRTDTKLDEGVRYWKLAMGLSGPGDPQSALYSPAKQAARADAPILIVHGRDDTIVPPSQAEEMFNALKANRKVVDILWLNGVYHTIGVAESKGRVEFLKAMDAWVEKYNPPN